MLESPLNRLVERYLKLHAEFHPVDATFMGLDGYDSLLPPADPDALERERAALSDLESEAAQLEAGVGVGASAAERLERRMLVAQLRVAGHELEERPRFLNPAWYTGEAAFGIISLLLPSDPPRRAEDLRQRLEAMPAFLALGAGWLRGRAIPADWVTRARLECEALTALLERGLQKHELWSAAFEGTAQEAVRAVRSFSDELEGHPDRDPSSGEAYLDFLMREAHGLPDSPLEAEEIAREGFETARLELQRMARVLNPNQDWRLQLAALDADHPSSLEAVIPTYRAWQDRTFEAVDGLVTPATQYGLEFQQLPEWAREVAGALYFLFYRSPAAGRPGQGSVYWVFPPSGDDREAYLRSQNIATIKSTHIVHHGSIGHHTQNTRARQAAVRLGQIAGTDCASGIAMLGGGTMIEGWACYAQELMLEVNGFYSPLEELQLRHNELRNTAMCLADIRLHRGVWTLSQMRDFYRDEVGIPANRLWAETTRNSMYPSTRLMYWLGTRQIRAARASSSLAARAFHDGLLQFGSVPIGWTIEELKNREP